MSNLRTCVALAALLIAGPACAARAQDDGTMVRAIDEYAGKCLIRHGPDPTPEQTERTVFACYREGLARACRERFTEEEDSLDCVRQGIAALDAARPGPHPNEGGGDE
jgi:hypothetical protein